MERKLRSGDLVTHNRYGQLKIDQIYTDETGDMAVCRCNIDGREQYVHFSTESLKKKEIEEVIPVPPRPYLCIGDFVESPGIAVLKYGGHITLEIHEIFTYMGEERATSKFRHRNKLYFITLPTNLLKKSERQTHDFSNEHFRYRV
jgi:hypothetical protein